MEKRTIPDYDDSFVKVVEDDPNAEKIFIESLGKPEKTKSSLEKEARTKESNKDI